VVFGLILGLVLDIARGPVSFPNRPCLAQSCSSPRDREVIIGLAPRLTSDRQDRGCSKALRYLSKPWATGHGDNLANEPCSRARAIDVIPELLLLMQELLIAGQLGSQQRWFEVSFSKPFRACDWGGSCVPFEPTSRVVSQPHLGPTDDACSVRAVQWASPAALAPPPSLPVERAWPGVKGCYYLNGQSDY